MLMLNFQDYRNPYFPTPPAMSLIAAGTSVTPITVTTDPVTTGGNSLQVFQIISQK